MANNVETRVVAMEFDNEQFEKKASGTLTTLEKLKKSLKFENASSGFDTLQKSINKVSFSSLTDQVSSIDSAFTTLAGRLKVNFFDRISNMALNTGAQLMRSSIGQIISGGKSRATNIAQAKFKMEGMGVTWEQIKEDLDYAVDGTAYGLDAAANIASQLTASGVELGESMKTALRGVSGVAAMTSSSYEEIGNVFAAVAGQGRVMAMQLNQLSLRGINAAATLANYLGVTEAEVRDLVSKGKVDFNTFAAAMDSAFGEHAKEANKTFTGAMSNIKSALSRIGELFYSPFYDSMINPLNSAREVINSVTTALKETDETGKSTATRIDELLHLMSDIFTLIIKKGGDALKTLLKHLDLVNIKMDGIINTAKSVKAWLTSIVPKESGEELKKVAEGIDAITEAEKKAAWDIWKKNSYGTGTERIRLLEEQGLNAKRVQTYLNALIESNFDEAKAQEKLGLNAKSATKEIEKQVKQSGKLTGAAGVIKNLAETLGIVFKNLKIVGKSAKDAFVNIFPSAKENGIIFTLSEGLLKLVKKLQLTDNDAENLRKTFEGFFSILKIGANLLNAIFNAFRGSTDGLEKGDSVILKITGSLGEFFTELNKLIEEEDFFAVKIKECQEKLEDFFDKVEEITGINIYDWFHNFSGKIKEVSEYFADHGLSEGIKHFKDQFVDFVKTLFSGIFNRDPSKSGGFFGFITNGVGETKLFLESLLETFDSFYSYLRTIVGKIGNLFSSGWNALFGISINAHDDELEQFTERMTAIPQAQEQALVQVKNTMDDLSYDEKIAQLNAALAAQGDVYTDTGVRLTNMSFGELGEVKQTLNNNTQIINTVSDWTVATKGTVTATEKDFEDILGTFSDVNTLIISDLGVLSLYKISQGIEGFGRGFQSMAGSVKNLGYTIKTSIKRVTKAIAFEKTAAGIKDIAKALAIIVVSIIGLAVTIKLLGADGATIVKEASIIAGGILAAFLALAVVIGKFVTLGGTAALASVGAVFIALALGINAATAAVITLATAMEADETIEDKFKTIMKSIGGLALGLVLISVGLGILFTGIGKHIGILKGGDALLSSLGKVIFKLAMALLVVAGVVWIFTKIDHNRLWDAVLAVGTIMLTLTLMMGVLAAPLSHAKDARAIEETTNLVKRMTKSILVIGATIAGLSLFYRYFTDTGDSIFIIEAIGTVAGIIIGMSKAYSELIRASKYVDSFELQAIENLLQSMTLMVFIILGTMAGVAIAFKHAGALASLGALVSLPIIVGSIVDIFSDFSEKIVNQAAISGNNDRGDRYMQAAKVIRHLCQSLIFIAGSLATLTVLTGLFGGGNLLAAAVALIGTFAAISYMFKVFIAKKEDSKTGLSAYEKISKSVLTIAEALAVMALAYGIVLIAIKGTGSDGAMLIDTFVALVGTFVLILTAMAVLNQAFNEKDIKNLPKIAASFAVMSVAVAAMIGAVAVLAHYTSDYEAIASVVLAFTGLITTIGVLLGVLQKIGKAEEMAKIAGSLSLALIALGSVMFVVGNLLKTIAKTEDAQKSLEKVTGLILVIGGIIAAVMAITAIPGFNGGKAAIGLLLLAGGIIALAGALQVLSMVNYKSLGELAEVLSSYSGVFTQLSILLGLLLLIGGVAGTEISIGVAAIALAITGLGLALIIFAAGIEALAKALALLNGESINEIPDQSDLDILQGYAVNKDARGTGSWYAKGLARGLLDEEGNLTDAGRRAGRSLSEGTQKQLGIASPSKVGIWLGEMYSEGLVGGTKSSNRSVRNASADLGKAMIDGFTSVIERNDPSQYAADLGDDFADAYGSSINDTIGSMEPVSLDDGFGDFDWDYSKLWDDAPISPTISPVIDSEELDTQLENTKMDISNNIVPAIEIPEFQIPDVSFDEAQFAGLTDPLTDLVGEGADGGLLGGLTDALNPDTLFGTGGLNGLLDGFNTNLDNDMGDFLVGITGSNNILGDKMSKLTDTLGSGNLFSSDDGLMGMLGSILEAIVAGDREGIQGLVFGDNRQNDYDVLDSDIAVRTIVTSGGQTYYQYANTGDTLYYRDSNGKMRRYGGDLRSIGSYTYY